MDQVSEPGVSRALARLETEMGTPLSNGADGCFAPPAPAPSSSAMPTRSCTRSTTVWRRSTSWSTETGTVTVTFRLSSAPGGSRADQPVPRAAPPGAVPARTVRRCARLIPGLRGSYGPRVHGEAPTQPGRALGAAALPAAAARRPTRAPPRPAREGVPGGGGRRGLRDAASFLDAAHPHRRAVHHSGLRTPGRLRGRRPLRRPGVRGGRARCRRRTRDRRAGSREPSPRRADGPADRRRGPSRCRRGMVREPSAAPSAELFREFVLDSESRSEVLRPGLSNERAQ